MSNAERKVAQRAAAKARAGHSSDTPTASATNYAPDAREAIERIRPAVYQIRVQQHVFGTAFLVAEGGWFITANHVIELAKPAMASMSSPLHAALAIENVDSPQLKMRANFVLNEVSVVATDAFNDLALVRLANPKATGPVIMVGGSAIASVPTPVSLVTSRPTEGEPVAVSGYPLDEPAMVTNAGIIASSWAQDNNNQNDRYLGDFTANPGNSGGPVYRLEDSGVLGVCVGGKLTPTQGGTDLHHAALTIVVPSQFVESLLTKARATT